MYFLNNFEISWTDCKEHLERNNSAKIFVDMMINNLNCKVGYHIPQNKKSMNMYTLFILTFENVDLIDKSVCENVVCYSVVICILSM